MQQCWVKAHNVDIVLVAQISIFTQTVEMGVGGGGGGLAVAVVGSGGEGALGRGCSGGIEKKRFYNSDQSHQNTERFTAKLITPFT